LHGLETKDEHRVLAGSGRQTADLKPSRIVRDGGDFIGAALGSHGRARDGLSPGPNDARLNVGRGYASKDQQCEAGCSQH
jgi:hypothetical protein